MGETERESKERMISLGLWLHTRINKMKASKWGLYPYSHRHRRLNSGAMAHCKSNLYCSVCKIHMVQVPGPCPQQR